MIIDAAIIGQHAGTNLLVACYSVNTVKEVKQATMRFDRNNVVIKSTVLNAIEQIASNAYYYYNYEYIA